MPERWNVELTGAVVTALRALPREERRRIAERIDHLVANGLPPGLQGELDETGAVALPAGDQILLCVEDPAERRVLVVLLRTEQAAMRPTLRRMMRHTLPRWLTEWTGGEGMISILQDLKFAARSLRRSPGFTSATVFTLALGIGATAAIFSVANGVLFSPLPYADSDEVVTIWSSWDNFPDKTWVSMEEFTYWYQQNRTLEDVALYQISSVNFTSAENPERVRAARVTWNTFSVLGVEPVMGRVHHPLAGQHSIPDVLIGHDLWQRRFGGDPGVVGRSVEMDGAMYPVIGVLPEGFVLPVDYGSASVSEVFFPTYVDVETPLALQEGGSHGSFVVARLRDGQTVETARADLVGLIDQLRAEGVFSVEKNFQPRVYGVKEDIVGTAGNTILVLLGAVAFVLLIACGNVANLLLSRSEVRAREVAVRTALGAGRAGILRQLLTESAVLAAGGGALGLVFAWLGVDALLAIDPTAVPRSDAVSLDATVVLFTIGVSAFTALLFGVVPAIRVSHGGVGTKLHEGGRGGRRGVSSNRMQGLLVAAQMTMAVILLTGSGLMMKTFVSLLSVDPGFRAENVLTLRGSAPAGTYPDGPAVVSFYEELLRRVRELPGVETAGAARILPLASTMGDAGFNPVGYVRQPNESTQADWQFATPGYVETMGIPLIAGRTLESGDNTDGQAVVVINQTLANRYWPNGSPLGAEVRAMGGDTAIVVGVVGDVAHNGITGEVNERFYRPQAQVSFVGTIRGMTLTIATRGDPRALIGPVRNEIRSADPTLPVSNIQTFDEVLSSSVAQPRFAMMLLSTFGSLAIILAIVGIYGVLAYSVNQRTREIGVRMALGAESGQVVALVVRQGMVMALAGVAVGTGIAWFVTDLMSGMLYGVEAQDLGTFISVPALFAAVALLACWIPAGRAARVRPSNALRYE